jgi:hypothetical protein
MSDATYKVTEVVGTSSDSIQQAVRNGIARASQTLRNLDWFEVTEIRGHIVDRDVGHFQVTMKILLEQRLETGVGEGGREEGANAQARSSRSEKDHLRDRRRRRSLSWIPFITRRPLGLLRQASLRAGTPQTSIAACLRAARV